MLGALRQSSRAAVSMVSKRSMSSGVSLAEEIKEMKKWKVGGGRVWLYGEGRGVPTPIAWIPNPFSSAS